MSLVPQWQEDGNNRLIPRQKSLVALRGFFVSTRNEKIFPILFIGLIACSDFGNNPKEDEELPEDVSFNDDIQPLFNASCINCHGNQGKLSVRNYTNLMKAGSNNSPVVIPKNSGESLIIKKLQGIAFGDRMPPEPASKWSDSKIELVKKWIDQGALNN